MTTLLIHHALSAVVILSALSACGGGDDGANANTGPVTTELLAGGWQGGVTLAENYSSVQSLILDDGTFWAILQTQQGSVPAASSLLHGHLVANGGLVTSRSVRMHDLAHGQSQALTALSGTFAVGKLDLQFVVGGVPGRLPLEATHMQIYPFENAATLPTVAGRWQGGFAAGNTGTLVVSDLGNFEVTSLLGCQLTGRLTPSASGKNVFDTTVQYGPAPCSLPGGVAAGKTFVTKPGTGRRQLALMAISSDGMHATVFYGGR